MSNIEFIVEKQQQALKILKNNLTDVGLLAELEEDEESSQDMLAIVLENIGGVEKLYGDIYFLEQTEQMLGCGYCVMDFPVGSAWEIDDADQIASLCIALDSVNLFLNGGGYFLESNEGELPLGNVVYRHVFPVSQALNRESMAKYIYVNLELACSDLIESVGTLMDEGHMRQGL